MESGKWKVYGIVILGMYFILWLPLNFKFSAQLPAIHFPVLAIYISLVLLAIGTFVMVWVHCSHCKKGGLRESGDTIIFYKEGPYSIMRHPGGFGLTMWFICLPIILSAHVPFTPLSIVAIIMMIVLFYHMACVEEKINVEKWGDEYRWYMKKVPRFNFIKGLWNLRKKR